MNLTPQAREQYQHLFDTCEVRPERKTEVDQITNRLIQHKDRYQTLEALTDVPWYIIAVIHNMEASGKFNGHLHNGDPLTHRTVQVPPGRPPSGNPPFTFEESGVDAMRFDKMDQVEEWTLPGALFRLEGFNGFGYRPLGINSPYLWSFSNHYSKGKFNKDGHFDSQLISKQCGVALLLRQMMNQGAFSFPLNVPPSTRDQVVTAGAPVAFSNSNKTVEATRLQKLLNRFPGATVKLVPDGVPGQRTSGAFKDVTGSFLAGDPRA